MKKEFVKPFMLGMVGGAIVLLIVIFSAGWVVTSGSAQAKAVEMSADAVLDRLVPIAVAQFMQEPNREEQLKEMKKLDTYGMDNRSDYIKKQGWAIMPGEKEPDGQVADALSRRLVELEK